MTAKEANATATERQAKLLEAEGVDGVELGGSAGGVEAEEDSGGGGYTEGEGDGGEETVAGQSRR